VKALFPLPFARLEELQQEAETVKAIRRVEEKRELAEEYLTRIGWTLYEWQQFVLEAARTWRFVMLVASRQVGKTFLAAGRARCQQVSIVGSSTPVVCPNQDKSKLVVREVKKVSAKDPDHVKFDPDSTDELGEGGSRIKALPGTVGGIVGETAPLLMVDEAGLVTRDLYDAATPTQAHIPDPECWIMSSAWYKEGWFYEAWDRGPCKDVDGVGYVKVLVRPPFDIVDHEVVDLTAEQRQAIEVEHRSRNIHLFWSETPSKEWVEQELSSHGEAQVRQQYFCEFQETEDKALSPEYLERMWVDGAGARKIGGDVLSEGEGRRV
jgi:hypothetical protein